jgi:anti-sigma B factor antagonist
MLGSLAAGAPAGSPGPGTDRRLTLVLGGVSTPVMKHVGDEAHAGKGVNTDSVSIACRRDGTTGVVVLSGELDLAGGDAVEATVAALLADGAKDVSVQADGLSFMDSSGLGGVLAARALVIEAGGEFRFGPTTDTVARVIDLAGVGDLLGPTTA